MTRKPTPPLRFRIGDVDIPIRRKEDFVSPPLFLESIFVLLSCFASPIPCPNLSGGQDVFDELTRHRKCPIADTAPIAQRSLTWPSRLL